MYKVIKFFTDLRDNEHPYNVGDVFPREGVEVTDERLAELASESNRQGVPLIELVEDEEPVKPEKEPAEEPEVVEEEAEKEEKPKKKTSKK